MESASPAEFWLLHFADRQLYRKSRDTWFLCRSECECVGLWGFPRRVVLDPAGSTVRRPKIWHRNGAENFGDIQLPRDGGILRTPVYGVGTGISPGELHLQPRFGRSLERRPWHFYFRREREHEPPGCQESPSKLRTGGVRRATLAECELRLGVAA